LQRRNGDHAFPRFLRHYTRYHFDFSAQVPSVGQIQIGAKAVTEGRIHSSRLSAGDWPDAQHYRISQDAKLPSDYIRPVYRTASEAIATFVAGGMADVGALDRAMNALGREAPNTVWDQ
jgi:hypothetical protein